MSRSRRKKKKSLIPLIISAIAVLWILFLGTYFFKKYTPTDKMMDAASYFGLENENEAAIVINDRVIEEKGRQMDGTIYVDFRTVWDVLNSGFYWEEPTQTLYLTLPGGTTKWKPDDGSGAVRIAEGTAWISAECIRDNSDIDLEIFDNRIVARTSWDGLQTAEVKSDTAVRYRGGPKSEVLTTAKKGDTVVVTEQLDDWTGVSTGDGFIGYLRTKAISMDEESGLAHTSDERFDYASRRQQFPEKIRMGWQFVDSAEGNDMMSGLISNADGMNIISPTWLDITNKDGLVVSFANKSYVSRAHKAGLSVWAHFGDVKGKDVDIGTLFETRKMRKHIINQVISAAKKTKFDGINLDFESIREETAPQYLQFIRELSKAARKIGLYLSVDDMVPIYTPYYKRAEQANWVDYVIVMAYDEHTSSSDEAGSVASLPFVDEALRETLAEVPAEQVVCGIPFYTRGWTVPFGSDIVESEALGMESAQDFVKEHEITLMYDQSVGQNTGSSSDSEARYSIWIEDEMSIGAKLDLVRQYQLSGIAAWRLGFESDTIWTVIRDEL